MDACSPHPYPGLLLQCHWPSPGLRSHTAEKGLTSRGQKSTYPERRGMAMETAATGGPMVRTDMHLSEEFTRYLKSNHRSPVHHIKAG